jgi:hypothetical protein
MELSLPQADQESLVTLKVIKQALDLLIRGQRI